ncbi:1-acyl-sn-glycerol-3-phosphate acyltransferase [Arcobacter sp. 31_11_sub10_T18]|nr:1-acyl-sn-glycerol-3-phosphate acyltransferase [Arcobacter sp. 31_11_sub10_T18]
MSKIRGYLILIQFSITVAITIALMYIFKKHQHKIIKFWMKIEIALLGITLEETGSLDTSCDMVMMNHQSLIDIIIIEHIHEKHLAWVAKKEIADLFLFGHIIKAPKMISIDREDKSGIVTLLKETKDRLSKGRPIAIFPEGTRSNGRKISKFKFGAKMVADRHKLKVQPIVLVNTRSILDSKTLKATPGVVKIIYLDPVQADKKSDWLKESENKMREILERELDT